MRITHSLVPPIFIAGLGVFVSACSGPDTTGNTVDVGAAASRAQSDIANYAAISDRGGEKPRVTSSPVARAVTSPPTTSTADADPAEVVHRYADALAAGRYAEAWVLWDDDGRASGLTQGAFAASFDKYATYRATVGTPYDADAGAGQRYITVPVIVTGTLKTGDPFRLEGPVVLHRAAEGIESDDPHAHEWRIRSSEMKPRPIGSPASVR